MMGTGKQLHNSVVKGPYFCYFRAVEGGGGGRVTNMSNLYL